MKKTYITPEALIVALNTKTSILQASLRINSDSSNSIDDSDQREQVRLGRGVVKSLTPALSKGRGGYNSAEAEETNPLPLLRL